jgi:hypothetical protein
MPNDRIAVLQCVSQRLRVGVPIDVYEIVEALKKDFPGKTEQELERIVSEEVVAAHANAVWVKRDANV